MWKLADDLVRGLRLPTAGSGICTEGGAGEEVAENRMVKLTREAALTIYGRDIVLARIRHVKSRRGAPTSFIAVICHPMKGGCMQMVHSIFIC